MSARAPASVLFHHRPKDTLSPRIPAIHLHGRAVPGPTALPGLAAYSPRAELAAMASRGAGAGSSASSSSAAASSSSRQVAGADAAFLVDEAKLARIKDDKPWMRE